MLTEPNNAMLHKITFDTTFHKTSIFAIAASVIFAGAAFFLPESFGDKNSPVEYAQLALLLLCCYYTYTANNRRALFTLFGFVFFFLFLREINYGRTLWFMADPNDPNEFRKWKEIPYGWLAHPLVGIYLAALLLVFICRKMWRDVLELLSNTSLPKWELLCMVLLAISAQLVERLSHCCKLEESLELGFYTCVTTITWRYARGKCTPTAACHD